MRKKIIERTRQFIRDRSLFGVRIAVLRYLWFIVIRLPRSFAGPVLRYKHGLIIRNLKQVLGERAFLENECRGSEASGGVCRGNEPIWFCWLQGAGQMPPLVKICYDSVCRNSFGHPVIFVDLRSLERYVALPKSVLALFDAGRISPANFTDIIRTALLAQHGGLWLDATVYVSEPLPAWIFARRFYSVKFSSVDDFYIAGGRWSNFALGGMSSSMIYGRLLRLLYDYVERKGDFVDYFQMDYLIHLLYQSDSNVRAEIDNVPVNNEGVHRMQRVLNRRFSEVVLRHIEDSAFLHKLSWRTPLRSPHRAESLFWAHLAGLN